MKHAYLIIAHNEYPVLKTLLSMLDDERNDIYLHIDKRAKDLQEKIKTLDITQANFNVIDHPMSVHWGDISQIEVEYLLFETAVANGPYAYYHLLSGVDLPIKSQDYIHRFFLENKGKEFVELWQDEAHQRDLERKVYRYYFFTRSFKEKKGIHHHITAPFRNIALAIQKAIGYHREKTLDFKKGATWVSLTEDAVNYLISQKGFILRRMRYTLCGDEIFIQSLLWNSPFREKLYCGGKAEVGNMRKIDWKRGNPYVWQNDDYEELVASDGLFARKFSSTQMDVVNRIRQLLVEQQ
ncbi:MAG: glycosyl transferase [Paraprevotella sp.]|nr:glycosyl transferase [Paraprevotella sp.]